MKGDDTAKSGRRLYAVELTRGGAALAVTWFHLTNTYAGGVTATSGALGWLGVDCFFVISGFVIPLSLQRRSYTTAMFPAFMARRLIRLEPPYLVSIALVLMLQYASSRAPGFVGRSPDYAPAQVALHFFYLIPFSTFSWLSPVYWSLAYEFAFYVLAGLTFPLLWRRHVLFSIVLVCGASRLIESVSPTGTPRIPLFLMGLVAVRFHLGRDTLGAFGLGLACAAAVMTAGGGLLSAIVGCTTALALACAGQPSIRRTPWLGRISYSLYLTHVPVGGRVVNLGRRFVEGPAQEAVLSLVALGVCLAFATLFHRCVERPFTGLSRRVPMRRRENATGEAPS